MKSNTATAYRKPKNPGYLGGFYWPPTIVGFATVVLANIAATQYIAYQFCYQPALGASWISYHGISVYPLYKWFPWVWTYGSDPLNAIKIPVLTGALIVVVGSLGAGTLFFAINVHHTKTLSRDAEDLHGSAKWATKEEIQQSGLLNNRKGVYVGGWRESVAKRLHYLRHNGPEHILAFAPTRSGKGAGLVIPTLLAWQDSAVIYDIKGENWAKTSGFRSRAGHLCFKFAPLEPDTSSRFNPLAEIRVFTDRDVGDAQNVALLLMRNGQDSPHERHWIETAESLLTGMILHVCYAAAAAGQTGTIGQLSSILTRPGVTFKETLDELMNYEHDPEGKCNWHTPNGDATVTHPVVREKIQEMLEKEEREFSSVLSTAKRSLSLYSDPLVSRTVAGHDFTITDLVQHERPVSLYLVLPPSDYERLIPLIRLVITMILNRLTEQLHFYGSTQLLNKHRLLFMIDEFPSLRQMNIFANALSYMGGYGIKAFLITQDIKQIVNEYGPNQSITSNCHIRIAYTPNEIETAELLSKYTGTQTISKADFSFSGSRSSPIKSQMNQSVHQIQRPLMTPDEILKLTPPEKQTNDDNSPIVKPGKMLILVSGMSPIQGEQMLYFFDPVLSSRAALPPPHRLPRIARREPEDSSDRVETLNPREDPRSDGRPRQMVMNLSAPPDTIENEL